MKKITFDNGFHSLAEILVTLPKAAAIINGDNKHPNLHGMVLFFDTAQGVLVATQINDLPKTNNPCAQPVFGFHIHSGEDCSGNKDDPFANTGMHFNPNNCPHPFHAGDMPPLFGVSGSALSVFLTDRITLDEILGKTVIIHSKADDFTTQPSGNSGTKIACGKIFPVKR